MTNKQENDIRIKQVFTILGEEFAKLDENSSEVKMVILPKDNGISIQFHYESEEAYEFVNHLQRKIRLENEIWFDSEFAIRFGMTEWFLDYFEDDLEMSN